MLGLLRFGLNTRGARILKDLRAEPPDRLPHAFADAMGIPPPERAAAFAEARARAAAAITAAARAALRLVTWLDPAYPPLLHEIVDPPPVLWCAGHIDALARPAIAIVGSRRAAPTGLRVARSLANGLAECGLVIVSGLARGIDAAAHHGALEAGGATVAVLGNGGDLVYPREHGALVSRLQAQGAAITEFPPGTPPLPAHFPMRNRIISGLCRAVVVIEAHERSGSLITARLALEQGREVLAVPGTVASGQHTGCHALIKDGAALVETVDDILNALGWQRPRGRGMDVAGKSHIISKLETAMAAGEPYTADELAALTGLSGAEVLSELGVLEVAGIVGRIPGAGFVRVDKSVIGGGNG
jgi:DNA processing protein